MEHTIPHQQTTFTQRAKPTAFKTSGTPPLLADARSSLTPKTENVSPDAATMQEPAAEKQGTSVKAPALMQLQNTGR